MPILVGPPGFEPGSPAPQAERMDQATPRPHLKKCGFLIHPILHDVINQLNMSEEHSSAAVSLQSKVVEHFLRIFAFLDALFKDIVLITYDLSTCKASHGDYQPNHLFKVFNPKLKC